MIRDPGSPLRLDTAVDSREHEVVPESDDVLLELYSEDDDPAETERLSLSLRQELLDIAEVEAVKGATAGPPPPGARGLDMATLGALLVSVQPTVEFLRRVVGVVQNWLDRNRSKETPTTMKVTINGQTIELTPTKHQQAEIVEQYLRSVATVEPS